MIFTQSVHFAHWHLVGSGCSQDHLFRLARLKAVIFHHSSSDGILDCTYQSGGVYSISNVLYL